MSRRHFSRINAINFGIVFLANQAFPLIFGVGNGGHGWTSLGAQNLTYLSFGGSSDFSEQGWGV